MFDLKLQEYIYWFLIDPSLQIGLPVAHIVIDIQVLIEGLSM